MEKLENDGQQLADMAAPRATEEVQMDPEIGILASMERNMFFDAGLQSAGHVIIGTAFQRHPELGDDAYLTEIDTQFTAEDHNGKGGDYAFMSTAAWDIKLSDLLSRLDDIIEKTADALSQLMEEHKGNIVAGTMRIHISQDIEGTVHGALVCAVNNGGKHDG